MGVRELADAIFTPTHQHGWTSVNSTVPTVELEPLTPRPTSPALYRCHLLGQVCLRTNAAGPSPKRPAQKFPHAKLQLWGKYNQAYFNKQTKAHLVILPHTGQGPNTPQCRQGETLQRTDLRERAAKTQLQSAHSEILSDVPGPEQYRTSS